MHLNNYIKHLNYQLAWLDVDVEPVREEEDVFLLDPDEEDHPVDVDELEDESEEE